MDFTKTILKGVKAWANSNFVNYNEQTLTDNQKAQVRENIGLVDPSGSFQELVTNEAGEQIWGERTHYEYTTEIVPETSYDIADLIEEIEGFPVVTSSDIIEGNDYIVNYNNTKYKTNCKKIYNHNYDAFFVIGNPVLFENTEDNGLPFTFFFPVDTSILPDGVQGTFLPLDQILGENVDESQIKGTYSIKGLVAKKLDPKFYNTPDWSAQEGEDGYIKNRTHGLGEYIEYFPETEAQLEETDGVFAFQTEKPMSAVSWIEPDKFYTITYNGVDYNCKFTMEGSIVYTGNASIIGGPASDEPFFMLGEPVDSETVTIVFAALDQTEATTITLKISNELDRIQKLDKKYLPDGLFYMEGEGPTMIMEPLNSTGSGTFTASAPLEENKKYIVTISGEEFNVKCHKLSQNENLYLYLGNASLAFEATDTKEGFLIFTSSNNPTNFNYVFRDFPYNSEFFIESAGSYSKIPSQHLPQPNWNANKGEEGYIENRTHYHIPGFTAHWDGVTEGKATANIGNITLYKISDNFLSIGYEKVLNLVGIQTEDGTIYKGWPLYYNNNNIMFQALSDNVSAIFFSCADAGEGTLFNPNNPSTPVGQYFAQESGLYIGSNSGLSSSTLDVIVLDETKQLDSMFIPDDFLYIKNGANESLVTSWSSNSDDLFGQHSLSLGFNSLAEGNYSFAIGMDTTAKGRDSFSSGYQTSAIGEDSHAEGMSTTAYGKGSHAEGYGVRLTCKLTGNPSEYYYTHNIPSNYNLQGLVGCVIEYNGYHTHISRITDTHINTWTSPLGSEPLDNAVVSIYPASSGDYTHTEGKGTNAIPACSHAEGDHTTAVSLYQHVQGRYNDTIYSSNCAHVVGNGTLEARSNAHTLNWDGTAWYAGDVYVGGTHQSDAAAKKLATEEYVDSAVANGGVGLATEEYVNNAIANLVDSSPETLNTLNELSAALGDDPNFATTVTNQIAEKANKNEVATNIVNGSKLGSVRTIETNETIGHFAFSEGQHTTASGQGSHAEGYSTTASGNYSHAEGYGTNATLTISGEANSIVYTFSEINQSLYSKGSIIKLNNKYAIITEYDYINRIFTVSETLSSSDISNVSATIMNGVAYGENSHSEGERTISCGSNSHTEGLRTVAMGNLSHAEGFRTLAAAYNSHVEGYDTIASGRSQHVQGKYNIEDTEDNYAHIVGNGTDSSRSNAHTLDWSGNGWFQGNVYVGGTSQNDAAAKPLIAAPTASVGQTIIVKAVDENGKPTEWEAANLVTEARVNELIAAALAAIPNAEEADF